MPKLCKRIIAFMLAFCLVCSLCFSAFAVTSENQATFWNAALARLAGSNDNYGFNLLDGWGIFDSLGTFIARDTVCGQSSDGYHHGTQIDSLVDGRAKVRCTECNQWFYYSADDLQQDYQTYLHDNNLDGDTYISPSNPSDDSFTMRVPVSYCGANHILYPSLGRLSFLDDVYNNGVASSFICSRYSSYSYRRIYGYGPLGSNPDTKWGYWHLNFVFKSPCDGQISVISPSNISCTCLNSDGSASSNSFEQTLSISYIAHADGSYSYLVNSGLNVISCGFQGLNPDKGLDLSVTPFVISITPSSGYSVPSVPQNITINNNTYPVTSFNFETRTVITEGDTKIEYGDTEIKIYEGDTVIQTINYIIENDDPGTDPGNGDDSSTSTDPGTVDPGDASGSGCSGCCEQCALLLRQVNSYLLQIQTLVDQINDKLGPESDNYMEGIYNLLVEINSALDNLPTEPHKDYEAKLTAISNQLANIWGDLDDIKTSLSAVQTNTATTNQKLDTVHTDLQAVLSELQTQRGILSQILSVLRDILSHVITIDKNVDELSTEEQQQDFIHGFIGKFSFINQIYQITVQMMRDVTNDAVSAQAVSDGIIPSSVLSAGHASPEDDGDYSADTSISNRAFAGPSRSGLSRSGPSNPTAPEIMTAFPDVEVLGFNLSQYSALDMSWYALYKSEVDVILSGFMYLGYLWLLFKRLPSIIRGGAMASSDYDKVQTEYYGKKGD